MLMFVVMVPCLMVRLIVVHTHHVGVADSMALPIARPPAAVPNHCRLPYVYMSVMEMSVCWLCIPGFRWLKKGVHVMR